MQDEFGVIFAISGAILLYSISAFILSRRERELSHYFFALMTISCGSSELLSFFEFTGTRELAYFLLKFDLSFLAIATYSYFMFADYFREGFNKKSAVISFIPAAIVIVIVNTVMITGVTWGPYGWAGVYNKEWNLVYAIYTISYLILVAVIFMRIYRDVEEPKLRWKIKLLYIGSLVLLTGSIINESLLELMKGRIFPITESSLMISAIIFAVALTAKPKKLYSQ